MATLSYVHRPGVAPLCSETIDGIFRRYVASNANDEAVVSIPESRRLTYAQLDAEVERVARGLVGIGVERGDRVGIWATDNIPWLLLQLATARIGAILVNVNPSMKEPELRHALGLARVQVLIQIPSFRKSDYVAMIRSVVPALERGAPDDLVDGDLPELQRVVLYDPLHLDATARPAPGFTLWRELIAMGERVGDETMAVRRAAVDFDDPVNIQFTSGTTGSPKAVVLTHFNLVNNAIAVGDVMAFGPGDRLCVPVPFYHCFGMVVSNLMCLVHGATIVIPAEHFEASAVLATIESERCTAVHGVPTMFIAELEREETDHRDLSSLRTGIMAGAPCPPVIARRVMEEMGCREILIAYGMTESSPVTHMTRRDDSFERRVETVGTNLPHQEVKIVDPDTGAIVPVGAKGEVCFRGPHVMRGYFDDPEATARTIDAAGWLHSGDLGCLDADGYLRITGRLKDMIIRGGENIYPAEIESVILEHPDVSAVAVFGVPDERMGEEVGAWIKLHDGATADAEAIRNFAREHLAHFKVPKHVWFVDDFPMTVTGKIQKYRIREMVEVANRNTHDGH